MCGIGVSTCFVYASSDWRARSQHYGSVIIASERAYSTSACPLLVLFPEFNTHQKVIWPQRNLTYQKLLARLALVDRVVTAFD